MGKKFLLALILIGQFSFAHSFVLWNELEYGSSLKEIRERFPDVMRPAGRDYYVDELNPVSIAGLNFFPHFIFDGEIGLVKIELRTRSSKVTYGDYISISNLLETKYGSPSSERVDGRPSDPAAHSFVEKIWLKDSLEVRSTKAVILFLGTTIDDSISIQYGRSKISDASKL
ncbi:MAG: hypothetical protein NWS01_00015 [Burkholderiales bacterium]|nr:hypothetical protein [Burkholderiales bacterium]